jgi:hypothetical protein
MPLMPETPKHYEDLSREQRAHFLYPIVDAAISSPKLGHVPTWRGRHGLARVLLATEMDKPSSSTREYWEEHEIPQPDHINDTVYHLIISGHQDFRRIATSANRRLRVERVRKKKRPDILRDSHELLKVARLSLKRLKSMTDPGFPILGVVNLKKPDAVYFGLHGAIPLRGTIYDADAGVVKLSETYDNWITQYREATRKAEAVVGCPAPYVPSERKDGSKTNLLALGWESYVDGVYAGKPRPELKA